MTRLTPTYLSLDEYFVAETLNVDLVQKEHLKLEALQEVLNFVAKYKDTAKFSAEFDLCEEDCTINVFIKACKLHTEETRKTRVEMQVKIEKEKQANKVKHELMQLKRLINTYGVPAEFVS